MSLGAHLFGAPEFLPNSQLPIDPKLIYNLMLTLFATALPPF